MGLVLTQEGGVLLWQYLLGIVPPVPANVHLLGSSHQPTHADTMATLAAAELAVQGYTPIALARPSANWTLTAIINGGQASYVTLSWQLAAACTVYGYWLSDSANQTSLFAEAFAAPFVIPAGGDLFLLNLTPEFTSPP